MYVDNVFYLTIEPREFVLVKSLFSLLQLFSNKNIFVLTVRLVQFTLFSSY